MVCADLRSPRLFGGFIFWVFWGFVVFDSGDNDGLFSHVGRLLDGWIDLGLIGENMVVVRE